MKVYGLQIGCNKIFTAERGYEVFKLTTFSEMSTSKVVNIFSKYAKSTHLEEDSYETIRKTDPDLRRVPNSIEELYYYSRHTYHFLVDKKWIRLIKDELKEAFPSNLYFQL